MEASSEFFVGGYFSHAGDNEFDHKSMENQNITGNSNNFTVDDLLDFPKEDEVMTDAFFDSITGNSGESSSLTVVDSCNSSVSGGDRQFNGNISCRSFTDTQFSGTELCVPYDDLAELEWLSNFVEESFSSDDLHNLHLISPTTNFTAPSASSAATANATTDTSSSATTISTNNDNSNSSSPVFPSDVSFPGKARSKRSRAAPCNWASRLVLLASPATSSSEPTNDVNTPNPISVTIKAPKPAPSRKRETTETPGRQCLHCGSEKTPQWRTGPMGPKTLCNACGVRYKSGRLVPEYRPAASPTFVSAKHSNSHRKVLELRRQKELQRQQQQQQQLLSQASIFGVSNGGDEYLIHHHHHHPHQQNVGPDHRLMI
ncbi:GATA transcription factor 9-like [Coffea arabica]|uniref:GATA transcription factor n=1 Tax=Coffea arabica TaxID=13443 RepID=A0A6P6X9X4_COFAR|nr:GATA transcription factor 12-like [Coffea arabica]